jgi:hypothetical protein
MRLVPLQAAVTTAAILLQPGQASLGHRHAHSEYSSRHDHSIVADNVSSPLASSLEGEGGKVEKRSTCSLPTDSTDLFHVPGASNNGFAMSPDQACTEGVYCPIACVSGKVMAQWQPGSTYVYPQSMVGWPFPGRTDTIHSVLCVL